MPFAVYKKVYSCNSEDPNYPASNLLKHETDKKWKTSKNENKTAYVVLELEKPELITGIDIGNEHSAFVEVLVNKIGSSLDEFKELLLTSSFMTPFESKNSTCMNRVRCFGKDRLLPSSEEKYDLIKFICTQPFNKHVQYGLSFVKIHVAETKQEKKKLVPDSFLKNLQVPEATNETLKQHKFFGKFMLHNSDSDSDSEKSASIFNRWKLSKTPGAETKSKTEHCATTAAQIRDSSTQAGLKKQFECRKETKPLKKLSQSRGEGESEIKLFPDRNRSDLVFTEEDSKSNRKTEKQIELDKERLKKDRLDKDQSIKELKSKRVERNKLSSENSAQNKESVELNDFSSKPKFSFLNDNDDDHDNETKRNEPSTSSANRLNKKTSPKKRQSSSTSEMHRPSKKLKSESVFKPFNNLLENVVLTISGIQNPDRANLRTKALEMGAKYKADWENGCTHLICAFKNTPKYNQVQKAKGKIVKRTWIEDCHKSKKRYPWRKYALDSDEEHHSYSEDEVLDVSLKPNATTAEIIGCKKREKLKIAQNSQNSQKDETILNNTSTSQKSRSSSIDSNDPQYIGTESYRKVNVISSGSDTEDELEKIRNFQKNQTSEETEPKNHSCLKEINKKSSKAETPPKRSNCTTEGSLSPKKKPTCTNNGKTSKIDIYEATTEEEEYTKTRKLEKFRNNKQFYEAKIFYLNPRLHSIEKIKLEQYITQYGGECTTFATKANYLISKDKIDTTPKFTGEIISPLWVYECNDMECLLPTTRYLFS